MPRPWPPKMPYRALSGVGKGVAIYFDLDALRNQISARDSHWAVGGLKFIIGAEPGGTI